MLNSHMDVVEAVPEDWTYPPFSAYMDDEGKIYGRGAQDDKDISIEYIEAIRILKENNITLQRTIHMTLMPDEETGGFDGMVPFARSEDFKRLNVGFALDEGLPTTDDTLIVTNVDKRPWQMEFTIRGVAGHGSSMQGMDTAAVKLRRLLDVIMEFREDQMKISDSLEKDDGSFTSVNVNIVQGGIATNIVPSEFRLVVDMRLAITAKASDMDEMISSWIMATGANTTVKFIRKVEESPATAVDDSNPYWVALQEAACEMNMTLSAILCPATSDMVQLRLLGIPALGFSPKPRTANRVHGVNEYLSATTLMNGVDVYVRLLKKLGDLPQ